MDTLRLQIIALDEFVSMCQRRACIYYAIGVLLVQDDYHRYLSKQNKARAHKLQNWQGARNIHFHLSYSSEKKMDPLIKEYYKKGNDDIPDWPKLVSQYWNALAKKVCERKKRNKTLLFLKNIFPLQEDREEYVQTKERII